MTDTPDPPRRPLEAFLRQYAKDRGAGSRLELHEYLALFPGDEEAIAFEYLARKEDPSTCDPEDAVTMVAGVPGERLGAYLIVREIGHGGQGIVFEARDPRLGRRVAIKILTGRAARSEGSRARLRREAVMMARLDDPGLCQIHEAGFEGDVPFIVMRFVEGESFARRLQTPRKRAPSGLGPRALAGVGGSSIPDENLQEPGSVPNQIEMLQAVEIIEQAARSLHVAHESGVIHRDIKPGNIMIGSDGRPVLMDFGLARADDPDLETLTLEGDHLGTPEYMSPEQLTRQSIRLDRRTDIWSLGVCLYESATGRHPFRAPTREGTYQAILSKEPMPCRRLNAVVSKDLAVVIETALQKDRDRRYQTALDLAEDLHRARAHEPIAARPVGRLTKLARWAHRNPGVAVSSGSAVLILIAGIVTALLLLARSEENLDDWTRLADGRRLEALTSEANTDLWPAVPAKITAMERWIVAATRLATKHPEHEAALGILRARALPFDGDAQAADRASFAAESARLEEIAHELSSAAGMDQEILELKARIAVLDASRHPSPSEEQARRRLERQIDHADGAWRNAFEQRPALERERDGILARISTRKTWAFQDPGDKFRHDRLHDLVTRLEELRGPASAQAVTIAGVGARLALARKLKVRVEDEDRGAWVQCLAELRRAVPPYGGLELQPIPGLVPLGWDSASGLWEFWHVASGEMPKWEGEPLGGGRVVLDVESGGEGLVLVLIPAGLFSMGAERPDGHLLDGSPNVDPAANSNESPVHEVSLAAFFVSKYEVTQGQWERLGGENPSFLRAWASSPAGIPITGRYPVTNIDWDQSREACRRWELELPTEAQWEYACRGGTTMVYYTGNDPASLLGCANIADASRAAKYSGDFSRDLMDGFVESAPVGALRPNGFGLFDIHGNVWEWCLDAYRAYDDWPPRPDDGLRGPLFGARDRVNRGGSFRYSAIVARSAHRDQSAPSSRASGLGCRPARITLPTR